MSENMNNGLGWLERCLKIIDGYKFKTIFKAIILIMAISFTVGFINNPTYFFEKYKEWDTQKHKQALDTRMKNNTQIQLSIEKLLYKTNAKRVVLLELHNGITSNGNLPFAKCSATYEALNNNVAPVSDQYQNRNLTLMPFATELFKTHYFCGDTEELLKIDKGLYYQFKRNETEHFACSLVQGLETPLAILLVSFDDVNGTTHNCNEIHNIIHQTCLELALLCEIKNIKN